MRVPLLVVASFACRDHPSKLDHVTAHEPRKPTAPLVFDADAIDTWVAAQIEQRGAVGAALVVVRDGKTVLAKGYGMKRSDGTERVDADTPFALGSISKQFTCAAAYSLVDEGRLAMTDAVATWYPQLTRARDVTLADLGGHTAGYRDYYPLDYVDTRLLAPIAPDDLIERYAASPLDFEPRARYSYSNTGFVILARVVERVAGTSYGEAMKARIFEPAGMTASLVRPANAATGHVAFLLDDAQPAPLEADGWLFGMGDLWASANDLAKWDLAFAEGRVLAPESRRAMATPRTLSDGRSTGYGCGLRVGLANNETVLAHGGWVGGFWTFNAIVPRTKSAVVLLTNDETVGLGDLHDTIVRLVTAPDPGVPAIAGPPTEEVVRDLIVQLQRGYIDRTKLGDDLSAYFDDERVRAAAPKLRALGTPMTLSVKRRSERGGLEVTAIDIAFATKTISASVFRSPDGKIRQLQLKP